MSNKLSVSKIDAARGQLHTAIKLYFMSEDPIAIHTLVCAAHEILETLHIKRGEIPTFLHRDSPLIKDEPDLRCEYHHLITDDRNFFKHAYRDPERILEFDIHKSEMYLLDACNLLQCLEKKRDPLCQHYLVWLQINLPKVFVLTQEKLSLLQEMRENPCFSDRKNYHGQFYQKDPEFWENFEQIK